MATNRLKKGQEMRKITVKRSDLLAKLKENKVKHVDNYNKAVIEYKQACLVDIEIKKKSVAKALNQLKDKVDKSEEPVTLTVLENLYFDLTPPVSHEVDYQEIIEMFELEIRDEVEIDSIEFKQYYKDDWEWKGQLENQRLFYATKQIGFTQ